MLAFAPISKSDKSPIPAISDPDAPPPDDDPVASLDNTVSLSKGSNASEACLPAFSAASPLRSNRISGSVAT
ncbi:hypothetical protein D3C71_1751710 [compost metagenome]